jgi:hypothetical protein
MNQSDLTETLGQLAGLVAETNRLLYVVAANQGFDATAHRAWKIQNEALDLQHLLEGEASRFEARQMVDPYGDPPEAA